MKIHRIAPAAGLALLVFAGACTDQSRNGEAVADEATLSANEVRAAMDEMRTELRSTLEEFGSQISDLDQRYASANDETAREWTETREELRTQRQTLEADLAEFERATEEEASDLVDGIASDLEDLTRKVERAHLESVEDPGAFVTAARDRLDRLDQDFRTLEEEAQGLTMDARNEVSETVETFGATARDLRTQLDSLAEGPAQAISDERDEIAEDVASLTASVRRELFEARQGRTTSTSMNNP